MRRFVLHRLALAAPTVLLLTIATFALTTLARGDAAVEALRQSGEEPTREAVDAYRKSAGLDAPLATRYVRWIRDLSHGDLGTSILSREPVTTVVLQRVPPTLALAASAFIVVSIGGLALGALLALYRGSWLDRTLSAGSMLLASIPSFWLGLLLILVVAEWAQMAPVAGYGALGHLVLPLCAMSLGPIAELGRLTRSALLDVEREDFLRTARAKGLSRHRTLLRHGLPNALLPVLGALSGRLAELLGGAVIVETVFAWPGLGTALVGAVSGRDLPVISAYVLGIGICFVLLNVITDVVYACVDPRVRLGQGGAAS